MESSERPGVDAVWWITGVIFSWSCPSTQLVTRSGMGHTTTYIGSLKHTPLLRSSPSSSSRCYISSGLSSSSAGQSVSHPLLGHLQTINRRLNFKNLLIKIGKWNWNHPETLTGLISPPTAITMSRELLRDPQNKYTILMQSLEWFSGDMKLVLRFVGREKANVFLSIFITISSLGIVSCLVNYLAALYLNQLLLSGLGWRGVISHSLQISCKGKWKR